ncbi:unnamed protein product [Oikopleura dioica]|uniref:Uncharacterized protein n=1 Tax=Oikopleura dioica TaxID=34765 RepID=E4XKJ2_OIKDI|nr:unnamed protein product [Oikopleura dioica]CBY43067.1 unnamed protein product [Oikopleura dioica]
MTGHSMNLSKFVPSNVPGMTEAMRKGGKKGEKLFANQNVTKIYKIAMSIVVATFFLLAILSAVIAFGNMIDWEKFISKTEEMTAIVGEYIYYVLDYIAIVFILVWISILGQQEFGNLKRSDWQRFSH